MSKLSKEKIETLVEIMSDYGKEERRENINKNISAINKDLEKCNCMIYVSDTSTCVSANSLQAKVLIMSVINVLIEMGDDKKELKEAINLILGD